MGFGSSGFGTSGFGTGGSTPMSVESAWAISTHGVRVLLTAAPLQVDQFADGDALNAASWALERIDTGAPITVVGVVMHEADTVDLITLEALGDHLVTHEVTAIDLLDAGGAAAVGPLSAQFLGVVQTLDPVDSVTVQNFRDRDIANPPFQVARGLGFAGTFAIGPDGDYVNEAGNPLVRKLVLRRIGTRRGDFRHLPNYGIGIVEKEPIVAGGDLIRLRKEIEDQVREEPDVKDVTANLMLDRSGVLIIKLSLRTIYGASINLRMGSTSGRLVEV